MTEVIGELASTLKGSDFWAVRLAAALSLGEIGGDDARDRLLGYFSACDEPRVRRAIAVALGNFKADVTVAALAKALESDRSYFVSVAAARALANIGSDEAYGILSRALSLHSWQEVIQAAVFHGFSHAKEKRAVELAMASSRYGEHPSVRVAAIGCLGALGKELRAAGGDDAVVDHLIKLLNDKSIRARTAAIRALGRVGNRRALGPLREATRRECLDQLKAALEDSIQSLEKDEKKPGVPQP
jgi:aminopeptidase N